MPARYGGCHLTQESQDIERMIHGHGCQLLVAMEETCDTRSLQIHIDDEHMLAPASEGVSGIENGHAAPDSTLEAVECEDVGKSSHGITQPL